MKITRLKSVFAIFCSLFASVASADTYLCVAIDSNGFSRSDGWARSGFSVDREKYIFRRVKTDEVGFDGKPLVAPYVAYRVGEKYIDDQSNGCTLNKRGDLIFCSLTGTDFVFNKKDLLFQSVDKFGYVLQNEKLFRSDVAIAIGKCSKID